MKSILRYRKEVTLLNHQAQIEALLFVSGDKGVSMAELSQLLDLSPNAIEQQLEKLKEKLSKSQDRGLKLVQVEENFKFVTKKKFHHLLESYAKGPQSQRLSKAGLETLAIIAYEQPVERAQVDEIRGVQSQGPIQTLLLKKLIEEKGRKETPGRPILYGTSKYFLDYFGLKNLSDLPDITELENETEALPDLFFNTLKEEENGTITESHS